MNNNETPIFALIIGAGLIVALLMAIGESIINRVPLSPAGSFQQTQKQRCDAMNGRLDFDGTQARCYHTPMFRHPKLMFTEKFKQ